MELNSYEIITRFLMMCMLPFVNKSFSYLQVQIYELEEHKIETWRGKHYWKLKISYYQEKSVQACKMCFNFTDSFLSD